MAETGEVDLFAVACSVGDLEGGGKVECVKEFELQVAEIVVEGDSDVLSCFARCGEAKFKPVLIGAGVDGEGGGNDGKVLVVGGSSS